MCFLSILQYEGEDKVVAFTGEYKDEDKVVAFTGEYKDEDIVKFIQGEQLTKFSDEVSCLTSFNGPFFFSSFPFVIMTTTSCGLASIKTLGRS